MSICKRNGNTYKHHSFVDGICRKCHVEQVHFVKASNENISTPDTSVEVVAEQPLTYKDVVQDAYNNDAKLDSTSSIQV